MNMRGFETRKERQARTAALRMRLMDELLTRLADIIREDGDTSTIGEMWERFLHQVNVHYDVREQMVQHAILSVRTELTKVVKRLQALTPEQREASASGQEV